jgi:hypothetical protein
LHKCKSAHENSRRISMEAFDYKLEPVVGFEPTTDGLQNRCSTPELNWLQRLAGTFGHHRMPWIFDAKLKFVKVYGVWFRCALENR